MAAMDRSFENNENDEVKMDCKSVVRNNRAGDLNCNENVTTALSEKDNVDTDLKSEKLAASSFIQESSEFQWCMDDARKYAEDANIHAGNIFSGDDIQTIYNDISKNIDVNLAEIDMETFCSEDINSILSLPAVYGESFSSVTDNTQNTTESYSSTGKMETTSHSLSEGSSDMSIYKNKLLFSPVKETEMRLGTISTDSLDFCSLDKQDLNISCQVQKNNYMITFEGSTTQMSEDSNLYDMKPICRRNIGRGAMSQSDVGFMTWSKIQKINKPLSCSKEIRNKISYSLPSLFPQISTFSATNLLPPSEPLLLYNVQTSKYSDLTRHTNHSLSFLDLRISENNRLKDSKCNYTNATDCVECCSIKKEQKEVCNAGKQNEKFIIKHPYEKLCVPLGSIEYNNNTEEYAKANYGLSTLDAPESDNSLYFEDSLMEVTPPKVKFAYASPIKEEEPFDFSSGGETMKDSNGLPFDSSHEFLNNAAKVSDDQSITSKHVTVAVSTGEFPFGSTTITHVCPDSDFNFKESLTQSTQTCSINHTGQNSDNLDLSKVKGNKNIKFNRSCSSNGIFSISRNTSLSPVKRTSIIITKTCDNSTQIPIHVKNKAIQTLYAEDIAWKPLEQDDENDLLFSENNFLSKMSVRQINKPEKQNIYIYYPHYTLPDLSFLNKKSDIVENKSFDDTCNRTYSSTDTTGFKSISDIHKQPSSFNFGGACSHNPIKDWDSLSVLLPENVKNIIEQKEFQPVKNVSNEISTPAVRQKYSFEQNRASDSCSNVNMRRLGSYENYLSKPDKVSEKIIRRQSLQEFPQQNSSHLLNIHLEKNRSLTLGFENSVNHDVNNCISVLDPQEKQKKSFDANYSGHSESSFNSQFYDKQLNYSANMRFMMPSVPKFSTNIDGEDAYSSPVSDCTGPPREFFVSPPPHYSPSDSQTVVEEEMWKKNISAKQSLYYKLLGSSKDLISAFPDKLNGDSKGVITEKAIDFISAIYLILSDGIHVPVDSPRQNVGDCILDFIADTFSLSVCSDSPLTFKMISGIDDYSESKTSRFIKVFTSIINHGCIDYWFHSIFSFIRLVKKFYKVTSFLYLLTHEMALPLQTEIFHHLHPFSHMKHCLSLSCLLSFLEKHPVKQSVFSELKNTRYDSEGNETSTNISNVKLSQASTDKAVRNAFDICSVRQLDINSGGVKSKFGNFKNSSYDSSAGGNHSDRNLVVCSDVEKDSFPNIKQLRQKWEELVCTNSGFSPVKATVCSEIESAAIRNESNRSVISPEAKSEGNTFLKVVSEKSIKKGSTKHVGKKNMDNTIVKMTDKRTVGSNAIKFSGKKNSSTAFTAENVEVYSDGCTNQRRSMIPVHKSSKSLNRCKRSGSAPSGKGCL